MSNRWPPGGEGRWERQGRVGPGDTGEPESPVRTGDRADTGACRTRVIRLGFPASVSARPPRRWRAERVEDPAQGHHDGDDSADREDAHETVRRGVRRTLRNGILAQAATRAREPPREAGEPAPPLPGRGPDPDRLDRRNTDPAPHRIERREERDDRAPARPRARRRRAGTACRNGSGGELLDHRAQQPRDARGRRPRRVPRRAARPRRRTGAGAGRVCPVGLPSAMPMPISRRCASTTRLIRLNAARAAPASSRPGEDVDEPLVALGVGVREPVGLLLVEGDGGADPRERALESARELSRRPPPHRPPGTAGRPAR